MIATVSIINSYAGVAVRINTVGCHSRYGFDKLKSGFELHDSRISGIDISGGVATIHFSHAYIHKSAGTPGIDPGTGWSQEAQLVLSDVENLESMPQIPNTISDGYLEVGGIKHQLIPLPFKRKVGAILHLTLVDGMEVEIAGKRPFIELLGPPRYLEDFP